MLLSLRQPFAPGDHVVIDGHEGKVMRLTSRSTILFTLDGNHLRIPNAAVFKAVILNYTLNPRRRFDFSVGVGVRDDLVRALELGTDVLKGMHSVLQDPAPAGVIAALGDSSVTLRFFGWVDQREADFGKARSAAIRLVKDTFDEAGIEMPEPTYRIVSAPADETGFGTAQDRVPATPGERHAAPEGDTSVNGHLDAEVRAARESEEPDLLGSGGERE